MSSPNPRRRWYQFGLGTLLIGLTLFSLPLGYIAWEREQCRRGQQAIEILGRSLGQMRPEDFGEVGRRISPSGRPGWLKFILGDDQFREYEFVQLGGESLSDSDLRHLAAFPNLHGVLLGVTNVTDEGVEHLRGLKTVEKFYFIRNRKVSGKSWEFLAGWHHLSELSIGCDRFDNESILKLAVLKNLKKLDIRLTRITDAGLEGISSLTTLEALDLSETEVTDAGLQHLRHLTNLQDLNLGGTKVTDEGMKRLSWLTNLKTLSLLETQVTDEGLAQLSVLVSLEKLDVSGTHVSDTGLSHLTRLTNLKSLDLSSTRVSDAGLVHLNRLTNLKDLWLGGTKVTDTGDADLRKALPDTAIRHWTP